MKDREKPSLADPQVPMREAFMAAVKAERAEVEWLRAFHVPECEMADSIRCRPTGLNGEGAALLQERCTALAARGNSLEMAVWVLSLIHI